MSNKNNKIPFIILGIILGVIGITLAVYFIFFNGKCSGNDPDEPLDKKNHSNCR